MRFVLSCVLAVAPAIGLGIVFTPNSAGNVTGNFIQGMIAAFVSWVVCTVGIYTLWRHARSGGSPGDDALYEDKGGQ